jgi:5-methylcytosine-specific restriction protein A
MMKVCSACGWAYEKPPGGDSGRCPDCHAEYQRRQPTTAQKGLGSRWQRIARQQVLDYPFCAYCGATEDLTCDHVRPRALGGTADHGLRTLCRTCNSRKGAKPHVC